MSDYQKCRNALQGALEELDKAEAQDNGFHLFLTAVAETGTELTVVMGRQHVNGSNGGGAAACYHTMEMFGLEDAKAAHAYRQFMEMEGAEIVGTEDLN